jgi:hypothetical protein
MAEKKVDQHAYQHSQQEFAQNKAVVDILHQQVCELIKIILSTYLSIPIIRIDKILDSIFLQRGFQSDALIGDLDLDGYLASAYERILDTAAAESSRMALNAFQVFVSSPIPPPPHFYSVWVYHVCVVSVRSSKTIVLMPTGTRPRRC